MTNIQTNAVRGRQADNKRAFRTSSTSLFINGLAIAVYITLDTLTLLNISTRDKQTIHHIAHKHSPKFDIHYLDPLPSTSRRVGTGSQFGCSLMVHFVIRLNHRSSPLLHHTPNS